LAGRGAAARRGPRRREARAGRAREQAAAAPEALPATIDLAARREILRRLVDAVMALDEPAFSTIVRRYYEGRSTLEIAAQDGVFAEVVRQRLARARARLRERTDVHARPALAARAGAALAARRRRAPRLSHRVLRGLLMTERATRPLVWKAAAAAVAVALGAGAWYALEGAAPDTASSPVAHVPTAPPAAREAPALPPLPPARAEPAPVQAASAAPVEPAQAEPPPVRGPFAEAPGTRSGPRPTPTMDGNAASTTCSTRRRCLLDLAQSRLAAQGLSALAEPTAPFVILDEKGVGRRRSRSRRARANAPEPWHAYTLRCRARHGRRPLHRLQQASPTVADVDCLQRGCRRTAARCAHSLQNIPRQTVELHAIMAGSRASSDGGVLAGDTAMEAEWRRSRRARRAP
jgi:hypothetical protein